MGRAKITPNQLHLVKRLLGTGLNYSVIARQSGTSRHFVRNTAIKLTQGESVHNRPGQGRPRVTNDAQDRFIVALSKRNRTKSSREIASEVNSAWDIAITPRTVRGRLVENGLKSYTQKRRPYRSQKQTKTRLAWCRKHINWTPKQWQSVIFSDESHFEVINRKNRGFVRRAPHEKEAQFNFSTRTQGGGGTVSVWGCFTDAGPGPLVVYEGRLNADAYIELIAGVLPDFIDDLPLDKRSNCKFQQDNAPCHKAKKTLKWFKENLLSQVKTMDWPPTSPDLNPIENIWQIIDQRLKNYSIATKEQLEAAIKEIWENVSVATCQTLVASMHKRVKAVHAARGKNISHY